MARRRTERVSRQKGRAGSVRVLHFHERGPERVVPLSRDVPVERLAPDDGQDALDRDVARAPLEDERAMGLEDAPALVEAAFDRLRPFRPVESPVLLGHPRRAADVDEVRRVEDDVPESLVGEREGGEVGDDVWHDRAVAYASAVRRSPDCLAFKDPVVDVERVRVRLVLPEHPRAAAGVEDGLVCLYHVAMPFVSIGSVVSSGPHGSIPSKKRMRRIIHLGWFVAQPFPQAL